MTSSSLRAVERSRYPLLSLTSFHQSCPATALAICSHVSSKLFSWLHVGCTRTTKQAFTISIIADISTINHSAPSGTRVSASRPHRSFRHPGSTRTEPDRRAHRALLQLAQPSRVRVHLETTVDRPRPLRGPVRSTSAPSGTRKHWRLFPMR